MKQTNTNIILSPEFDNPQQAYDILNRISWGLFGLAGECVTLKFYDAQSIISSIKSNPDSAILLTSSQESYFSQLPKLMEIEKSHTCCQTDFEICWKFDTYFEQNIGRQNKRRILIDPHYRFNHEANQIAALQYSLSTRNKRRLIGVDNLLKFNDFQNKWYGVRDAYLYLTGPSVESVRDKPVNPNGLKIICNSLVKNLSLLEHIQPNVLMFSDPAYHFGVSKYAASFRKYVHEAMRLFPGLLCMIPERYCQLTIAFLGDEFTHRIIGIPIIPLDKFHHPTAQEFFVRKTENILTQMMIPISSSVAARIHISGADGRRKNDSGYWAHAKTSQISDQMKTIYETHPSLARDEDVEKYYEEHCLQLEELLIYGETVHNKEYYCQTQSMIPALVKRMVEN